MKKFFTAFSLMELVISFIVITIITSASVPVFIKKTQSINKNKIQNSIRSGNNVDGIANCRVSFKGKCLYCDNSCSKTQYQDKYTCSCKNCSSVSVYGAACKSCTKTHCRYCKSGFGYYKGQGNDSSIVLDKYRGSCASGETHAGCTKSVSVSKKICYGQCAEGYFSNGRVPCETCAPGYYQPDKEKESCKACTPGHKCPNFGNWQETPCGGGYYQPEGAQISCLSCGKGYYCPGPADIDRKPCGAGYFCPTDNETKKTDCGIGFYCPGPTDTALTRKQCPQGATTLGVNSISIKDCVCGANSYKENYNSATGAFTRCVICPVGYRCDGTYAHPCGAGTYQDAVGQTNCKNCPIGAYCPGAANAGFTLCPAGYYSKGVAGCGVLNCACASCKTTGNGLHSCTSCTGSSSACLSCASGYKLINRMCYKHPSKQSECPSGYLYVDNGGNDFCFHKKNDVLEVTHCSFWGHLLGDLKGFGCMTMNMAEWDSSVPCKGGGCCWESEGTAGGDNTAKRNHCTPNNASIGITSNYTGCSRTLCTKDLLTTICSNAKGTKDAPTVAEVKKAYEKYRNDSNKAQFCINDTGVSPDTARKQGNHIWPYCPDRADACIGSKGNTCRAGRIFAKQDSNGNNTVELQSKNGALKTMASTAHVAGSIRCVIRWVEDD